MPMPGWVANRLERERAQWFLWSPVGFALGSGIYLGQVNEPPVLLLALLGAIFFVVLLLSFGRSFGFPALMFLTVIAGFCACTIRTAYLATPVLKRDIRATNVDGWIEKVETRPSGGRRLVVNVISIEKLDRMLWPRRVQLTDRIARTPLYAGDKVRILARVLSPPGPVAPGAFDYVRYNWFRGIGAGGFALADPVKLTGGRKAPLPLRISTAVTKFRYALSRHIRRAVPGAAGDLVAALITGDRSGLDEGLLRRLREAGLAHLLAISGLHMSLVAGTLYQAVRRTLSVITTATCGRTEKKTAAVVAWLGAASYLVLSGAAVSTQRAFVMLSVMCLAIVLDRQAITMRNLAVAAWLVILPTPESVIEPGLQMSFVTVAVLIFFYQEIRKHRFRRPTPGRRSYIAKGLTGVTSVAMTTIVAGIATAPIAAFHFHKVSAYSLAANIVSVPIVGLFVMPFSLAGTLLVPFGLDQPFLSAAAMATDVVILVASIVSGWEGAVVAVPAIPYSSILVIVTGLFWLVLWCGNWR